MAKTDKEKILRLCNDIVKKEGIGSIHSLGKDSSLKMARWLTGIEDLDKIIGGGMPEGRVIEIFGPESSGKTSLGYHLAALHDLVLYIPVEGTFDAERAKVFGNKQKQLLVYKADYGEQALSKIVTFAEAGIPLVILDSIPYCKPREEIEKLKKAIQSGLNEPVNDRIGGVARLMTQYLPVIKEVIEFTGTTVLLINQVRDKMDALMFGDKTDTPGGRAIKHAASVRIQVGRKAWIEIPNSNNSNIAKTEKIGMIMKAKVVKSKVCNPMGEVEIPLIFDRGFVSFNAVSDIRKEIMKKSKQKQKEDKDES